MAAIKRTRALWRRETGIIAISILAVTLVAVFAAGAVAKKQDPTGSLNGLLTTEQSGVDVYPNGENCKGIVATPGSRNTHKRLLGGDFVPGGHAEYEVSYPLSDKDKGHQDFEVTDCVLVYDADVDTSDVKNLKKYDRVLDIARFEGVINTDVFELAISISLDGVSVGEQVCNAAKTTEGPSAAQGSNRKAVSDCFTVGGEETLQASAAVAAAECQVEDGESVTEVDVTITGDASVEITDDDGNEVESFDESGSTTLGPGDYEWAAIAGEGSELEGDDHGSFSADDCLEIQGTDETRKPKKTKVLGVQLAKTAAAPQLPLRMGIALFTLGVAMLAVSMRRRTAVVVRPAHRR